MQQTYKKEYKGILDWVGKVIQWELSKRLKSDHAEKWYMHKPESVLVNQMHQILGDWDTNRSHNLIQKTRLGFFYKQKEKNLSHRFNHSSRW